MFHEFGSALLAFCVAALVVTALGAAAITSLLWWVLG